MYKLSKSSSGNLSGVHPDLIRVVHLALTYSEIDFGVSQGVRTVEQQNENIEAGVSSTMNSRHIPKNNECSMACAVDLTAWVGGGLTWEKWAFRKIARAMFRAAIELGVQIEWGGHWKNTFDGPHFQLSWEVYP